MVEEVIAVHMHKFIDPLVRPNPVQMRHSFVEYALWCIVNGGEGGGGGLFLYIQIVCTMKASVIHILHA